jgi:manganese transport protein
MSERVSLAEVHRTVSVPAISTRATVWRRLLAFSGPAYLVSVGYIDPGNWATDLEGGSRFGYDLVWVLVMANAMAILLQTLSARLGIVAGRDLAQACRDHYSKRVSFALWILCEIAIAACDLAEVIGTAIALNLLFGLKIMYGVLITAADVLVLLGLQRMGMRKMEAVIISLVFVVGAAFFIEMLYAKPDAVGIVAGLVPHITNQSLFVAIGILGATVMPHNLYLHSALVQTRQFEDSYAGKREACKYNLIDSIIALNGSLFVNAAILILAAAVFFSHGVVVNGIEQAHELLAPLVGNRLASILFAVALLASGQSSTLTGTLAGQIVMEGFVNIRIRPVFRRLFTRLLAITPAVIVIGLMGEGSTYQLLLLSQVILSMQLAFAIIPLIHFTSKREIMGRFANAMWVKVFAWISAFIVIGLNTKYLINSELSALSGSPTMHVVGLVGVPVLLALGLLLLYVAINPLIRRKEILAEVQSGDEAITRTAAKFRRIGVAIERSTQDAAAIERALAIAQESGSQAEIVLIHVVVSAGTEVYGHQSSDTASREGEEYLRGLQRKVGVSANVEMRIGYGSVFRELTRIAREEKLDVLIMVAHGHRGIKDLVLGASISRVRHAIDIPVLVVQ